MTDILRLYQDPFDDTRWRVKAPNGEPTLASTEGYVRREDALANAARYLLLEPIDEPDTYVVHTTDELLAIVQDLEKIPENTSSKIAAIGVRDIARRLRALLQIPGGAL